MILKQFSLIAFIFFLFIGGDNTVVAQESKPYVFSIDAIIYGYHFNPTKKFLKKETQIPLEGTLKNVNITVYQGENVVFTAKTNPFGESKFDLKLGKVYKVVLTKTNYSKCVLLIDLESMPIDVAAAGIHFHGLELIMNSYVIKDTAVTNLPFAKLFYNHRKKQIDFEANKPVTKKGLFTKKEEESTTPIDLLKKSVLKNKDNIKTVNVETVINPPKKNKKTKKGSIYIPPSNQDSVDLYASKKVYVPKKYFSDTRDGFSNLNQAELQKRKRELESTRKQIEKDKLNARTAEDSMAIVEAEIILNSRTAELKNALDLIQLQEKEITTQRKIIYLVIFSSGLLLAFLAIVFKFYRDKRKTNLLLNENNKKITDSINYAKRIQESVLLNENEIAGILPNSFVYFQPRDIVSGDFYWFSEHNGKIVVAAVDCTGHGVPGAFLSLIGNTLLNEIIYEKKIFQPAEILRLLHIGVLKLLHQNVDDSKNMDGMELSVCVIDQNQKQILFAGAMNPIYIIKNNAVEIIEPDIQSIGGINKLIEKQKEVIFTEKQISIEKGMTMYLFTDGYMDQFGGEKNKKYNTSNFKKLLLEIQAFDVYNQKKAIGNAITEWRGKNRQVDDILVIGVKF